MDIRYNKNGIRAEFIIKPNGNPDNIHLKFNGADKTELTQNGGLRLEHPLGRMEFDPPKAFQKDGEKTRPVTVILKKSGNEISIKVSNYKAGKTISISIGVSDACPQPCISVPVPTPSSGIERNWVTYYGGEISTEISNDIYVDASNFAYITGYATHQDFPKTTGSVQIDYGGGNNDAFVVKFNPNRGRDWATFFGGSGDDEGRGISTDASGNVYFVGKTNSNLFPTCLSCTGYLESVLKVEDGFIVALNPGGSSKLWSTYFGGNSFDEINDIIIDGLDNIYVGGLTQSKAGFRTKSSTGAYNQSDHNGGLTTNSGFISKFNSLKEQVWSTYLGAPGTVGVQGLALDKSNNLFVTGSTYSYLPQLGQLGARSCDPVPGYFPICDPGNGAYSSIPDFIAYLDLFICRFDNIGALTWSTFYSGSSDDQFYLHSNNVITTDVAGNLYIVGTTGSSDFPTCTLSTVSYQKDYSFGGDAFILKFDNNGVRKWATYYGGSDKEAATGVVTDQNNNVFITGRTESSNLPVKRHQGINYNQSETGGLTDAFILAFDKNGERTWATYYGGSNFDEATSIALFSQEQANSLLFTGYTESYTTLNDFPVEDAFGTNDYFDGDYSGSTDAFIGNFKDFCNYCPALRKGNINSESVAEESLQNSKVSISPNPNNKGSMKLSVQSQENSPVSIEVYNVLGEKEYFDNFTIVLGETVKLLNIPSLAKGIYLLKIQVGIDTFHHKIIVN